MQGLSQDCQRAACNVQENQSICTCCAGNGGKWWEWREMVVCVQQRQAAGPSCNECARQADAARRTAQVLWAKGYTELVELMGRHAAAEGSQPHIDCYGNGEDLADVAATAKAKRLDLDMKGGIDHLDPSMHEYKVQS